MDDTIWWWVAIIFLFAGGLAGQLYFLGRKMSEPEKMITPITAVLNHQYSGILSQYKEWLASAGLKYRTSFQFGTLTVVVYQQENLPRFFSFVFHHQLTFSVESYLEDLTLLDTGTSGSGGLFPRPGAYIQSFPGISAQEAWRRHLEGEQYLTRKFGYSFVPLGRPYEQLLPEAMRLRMRYNRAQFLWPFRALYRFFVTRFLIRNKTIAQQFP